VAGHDFSNGPRRAGTKGGRHVAVRHHSARRYCFHNFQDVVNKILLSFASMRRMKWFGHVVTREGMIGGP
jgi:hypothetical protein